MDAMMRLCGSRVPADRVIGQHVFLVGCVCIPDEDGRPDLLIPDASRGVVRGFSTARYALVHFPLYDRTTSVLWSRLIPMYPDSVVRHHVVAPQLRPYQRRALHALAV